MSAFFASIRTTIIGLLTAACGGATLAGIIPEKWMAIMGGVCSVLIGLGFIAAKDANVSNAAASTEPHVVEGK